MIFLCLALGGIVAFAMGVAILGLWLRRHPSRENAERSSRMMHFLFFAGLVTPALIVVFYPGLTHLDGLVGIASLPRGPVLPAIGVVLLLAGLYLLAVSNRALRVSGHGANAFLLTKQIVARDIYQYTRNPMSLGFYLCSLAVGLISGSLLATCISVLGYIPAHIFFLRFFEELELELRFGESYRAYKSRVPFLFPKVKAA